MPCPLHPDKAFTERKGQQGDSFWSHIEGTGWCNASAKPVMDAWNELITDMFGSLGLSSLEDKRAWRVTYAPLSLPADGHSFRPPHYEALITALEDQMTELAAPGEETLSTI